MGLEKCGGEKGRERSRIRAICSEIVLLRTARGREREERGKREKQREDKNVPSFLRTRAVRRVASCPAEHRGVTFAGCDVENWIQVWGGMYRRRGKDQDRGRKAETRVAQEKQE